MNKALPILAILTLSGCGVLERSTATLTGYSSICVGGVMYYQFTSGASVAYNKDGSIKLCR